MDQRTQHVLSIQLEQGAYRSRLLRALESIGGAYRMMRRDHPISRHVQNDPKHEWIEIGLPLRKDAAHIKKWVLNSGLSMYTDMAPKSIVKRLQLAGINFKSAKNHHSPTVDRPGIKSDYYRRYKVSVFHLKALRAVPVQKGGQISSLFEEPADHQSPLWKRLEKTAVKALYSLGLDLGEVVIFAGEEGNYFVEEIHPTPDDRDAAGVILYAQAINSLLDELDSFSQANPEILIGMDPEFLLFDRMNRKVVPASRYLSRQGEAGCDVLRYRGRKLYPLAELRPSPGREPREVVRHLLHAFKSADRAIPENGLLWQAGGMPQRGFPLGGHLHFSGVPLTAELLRVLDNYLALPVAVIEAETSFRRRPLYGYLGDFRQQAYGGFEYRTLPSFLISPVVTKGVVALAKLIAEHYEQLSLRPLQHEKIVRAFYSGQQNILREAVTPLISDMTETAAYSRYESYIAPFLKAVQSGHTWDESMDIRKLWKM